MCYHKSSPKSERLEEYVKGYEIAVPKYKSYYHVSGFAHPQMPILTMDEPDKVKTSMWGLVPIFARDRKDAQGWANKMLNATSEKMDSTYKPYFKSKRCLIFVDGFYEWQWLDAAGKQKVPYFIHREDNLPFTLGGIYNEWGDEDTGELFHTYSVITTPANELMGTIHNNKKRMPAIIDEKDWEQWLDPKQQPQDLLNPFREGFLFAHEISKNITKKGVDTNVPETQAAV